MSPGNESSFSTPRTSNPFRTSAATRSGFVEAASSIAAASELTASRRERGQDRLRTPAVHGPEALVELVGSGARLGEPEGRKERLLGRAWRGHDPLGRVRRHDARTSAVQAEKRLHARPTGGLRSQLAARLAVDEVRERRRLSARREAREGDPRRPFDHPVVARRDRVGAGLRDGRDCGLELEPAGQHEQPDTPSQELGNRPSRQPDRQCAPHAAGVVHAVRLHPGALRDQALAVDDPDRHRPARLELALGLVVPAARGEKRNEGEEAEAWAHAGESTDR